MRHKCSRVNTNSFFIHQAPKYTDKIKMHERTLGIYVFKNNHKQLQAYTVKML